MKPIRIFLIVSLLVSAFASAQQFAVFKTPIASVPNSLFAVQSSDFSSAPIMSMRAMIIAAPISVSLPEKYNWRRDIGRRESLKAAGFEVYTQDCLGRDYMPSMAAHVLQQLFIKTHPGCN